MPLYILPFISVLLLFLASPGPAALVLSWISLIPLFLFLQTTACKKAFFTGWLAGSIYYLFILYWVTISMETYGGLTPWLSISGLILLCIYMGLYHGIFCFIITRVLQKEPLFPLWLAACLWVGLDYIRGFLFSGFPWMDMGYFHYLSPIRQLADLGGHHTLTFLVVLVNGVLYRFWQNRSPRKTVLQTWPALLCIAMAFAYCPLRLARINRIILNAPTVQTGIIQGNIDQAIKWKEDNKLPSVNTYISLTETVLDSDHPPKLIIWPETALPFYPSLDPLFYHVRAETVLQQDQPYNLLCGAPHVVINRKAKSYKIYNAALLLRGDKSPEFYFKQHLVPFGEYIPFRSILPFPKAIVESIGDFTPGTEPAVLQSDHAKTGVLICIEAIYPDLARKQVTQGAELLANITNDAWFGRSSAPVQHLAMTIFRAIENRRALARAANTGISALVSPTGEILESSALFTKATLTQPLPLLRERTFFNHLGFLFPVFCLAMAILLFIRNRKAKAIDD
jgi:apolipoprotein N-acyltransferase